MLHMQEKRRDKSMVKHTAVATCTSEKEII